MLSKRHGGICQSSGTETTASRCESFTICQLVVLTVSYFILSQDFLSTYFYSSLSVVARGGRATYRS